MGNFGRIITAMITPFHSDGTVNYAVAEQLADYLANNGSDGIVVCGTTGESPTLTWDEEFKLFQVVHQAVQGRAKVIAGTGSNSTSEAIAATEKAAKIGLDGTLQVVPYYNKPPQEGLYEHFRQIAQACPDLPMILYNIPGRTGQDLLPSTVIRLAEIPNIVGIKEATGSLDASSAIRAQTPTEFAIYSGDDSLTLPLMAIGATGVISVASHLVGNQLQQMVQAFVQGNVKGATEIHIQLFPLFKALFCTTNPIPIKAALQWLGWEVGGCRLPLGNLPESLEAPLQSAMHELKLLAL